MRLISFSVENYRSITKAQNLQIGQCTVLIGPNNEGKSNILRALVTSLHILDTLEDVRLRRGRLMYERGMFSRQYDWTENFPLQLQAKKPDGKSIFRLEFELSEDERIAFKREVKSSVNGALPIEIKIGKDSEPHFRVVKTGPGAATLSKKSSQIARFVGSRLKLEYFGTSRNAATAREAIERMVSQKLRTLEDDPEIHEAIEKIRARQRPILAEFSGAIKATLKTFLPSIKEFQLEPTSSRLFRAHEANIEMFLDDGVRTKLSNKGDGIQSLVALGVIRHLAETRYPGSALILAIEEPESHLHPGAIRRLKRIIDEVSKTYQVIVTTHSPVFVNRTDIAANVIVTKGKAAPAASAELIRKSLGVKSSDNLINAELVLLVEGEDDRVAMSGLLAKMSDGIKKAFQSGHLIIDSLNGGANLSYKASLYRDRVTEVYCFMDGDSEGKRAIENARNDGFIEETSYTLTACMGMPESEFEDLIKPDAYAQRVLDSTGIDVGVTAFRGDRKWSIRMKAVAQSQGKLWDARLENMIKNIVASAVAETGSSALEPSKIQCVTALVAAIESRLKSTS